MQIYCERCGPGLFDEPLNAASNAVFLVAAFAAWWSASRRGVLSPGLWALIVLATAVGIGSTLWHTFATSWAMVLDIVPIMLFQFTFLWLYGRYAAGLSRLAVGATLVVYVALAVWLRRYEAWLNGSIMYAPAVVLAWVVGVHHARSGRPWRFALLISAGVFCVALVCRSIDLVVCRRLPIGTHFLWHLLNGLVVYLAMRVVVEIWGEGRAKEEQDTSRNGTVFDVAGN
jgi:hypothetical protein